MATPTMSEANKREKTQAISLAIQSIEKAHGKGAIMRLGDEGSQIESVRTISTGSMSLDIALGMLGFPRGRVCEIYGPEASGKTTIALHAVAEAQKAGGVAAFIDAEHALDVQYAKRIGVNIDELLLSQPDTGEQALEIVDTLVRTNAVDLIVVDSVAALTPRAEIEGDMGDTHVGLQARLMSQALRKLTGHVYKSQATVLFINQIRQKIGVMFGSPETTSGGNALKFYCSVRLDIRRIASIKQGEEVVGNRVRVKVVKNKLAAPFRQAEFDILFGKGVSAEGELIDLGVDKNIVKKSGSWFSYGEQRLGQGREAVKEFLGENPDIRAQIKAEVIKVYLPDQAAEAEAAAAAAKGKDDTKAAKKKS